MTERVLSQGIRAAARRGSDIAGIQDLGICGALQLGCPSFEDGHDFLGCEFEQDDSWSHSVRSRHEEARLDIKIVVRRRP